jgi:hypothetical protein
VQGLVFDPGVIGQRPRVGSQVWHSAQAPQEPPQPLPPQRRPLHWGVQITAGAVAPFFFFFFFLPLRLPARLSPAPRASSPPSARLLSRRVAPRRENT